jgi:putative salt-induced outer membrane protein YdiY
MSARLFVVGLVCLCTAIARADTVKLANGDVINGEVVEWAVDHLVLDHEQLGRLRLELDQLALETGTPPNPGLFRTTFMRGWQRRIDLGLNGKRGTTDTTNITAGLNLDYTDDWKRWRINGRYLFQDSTDGDNDNNGRIDLRRDWLYPGSAWFAFLSGRYQYDQFESWNQRVIAGAGPGYHLVKTPKHVLDALLGANATREFGERQQTKWETSLALEYAWEITEGYAFTLRNTYYQETAPNFPEYRNVTASELRLRISKQRSLSLILGIYNEFESETEGDDQPNTLNYYATLGLDF